MRLPDDVLARVREDVAAANTVSARIAFGRRLAELVEFSERREGSDDPSSPVVSAGAEEKRCELTDREAHVCPCGAHGGLDLGISERCLNVAKSMVQESSDLLAFWLVRALIAGLQNR